MSKSKVITIGKCKMCLRAGVELQNSHFLPAAAYRQTQDHSSPGNPNPWLLTESGAVQTSIQQTAPLLCADCELRLSRNGEDWLFRNGPRRNGRFRLRDTLDARKPDLVGPPPRRVKLYYAAGIPEINVSAIAYFAASMFWKASVHPWKDDGGYSLKLGPWEEEFRRYLMEEAEFPRHATLMVAIRQSSETDRMMYAPVGKRMQTIHVHKFPIPGFAFSLAVSKQLPSFFHNTCFVRSPGNPLILSNDLEEGILQDAQRILERSLSKVAAQKAR